MRSSSLAQVWRKLSGKLGEARAMSHHLRPFFPLILLEICNYSVLSREEGDTAPREINGGMMRLTFEAILKTIDDPTPLLPFTLSDSLQLGTLGSP